MWNFSWLQWDFLEYEGLAASDCMTRPSLAEEKWIKGRETESTRSKRFFIIHLPFFDNFRAPQLGSETLELWVFF